MSPSWPQSEASTVSCQNQDFDDAEKGLYDNTHTLPILPPAAHNGKEKSDFLHIETSIPSSMSPMSPIHEGITPFSSVPALSLSWPPGAKAPLPPKSESAEKSVAKAKPKVSRWILFQLWFNPYRKFFTFVTLFNLTGIIMAALGRFPYGEKHLGALVLGNLLLAVLMRNELFLRFLYTIAIYGLRSVGFPYHTPTRSLIKDLVGTDQRQAYSHSGFATCWRDSFRMCSLWRWVWKSCTTPEVNTLT